MMMLKMKMMMSNCHVLLLLSSFFMLSLLTCTASSCKPYQRDALSLLNHSFTIHDNNYYFCSNTFHHKTASWRDSEDCCSWEGVVCDNSTGDVVALDLSCAGLQGTINPNCTLFSLRHLRRLNLAENFFIDSSIPEEIRVFSHMTHLNLSWSGISGNVPTEISQLSKLVSLDLSNNYGMGMQNPTMRMLVTNLTQLEELHLSLVNMSTLIPSSMMNFSSSLNSLDLIYTSLGGIFPEDIFQLPNLQKLDLSDNLGLQGTLPNSNWSHSLYFLSISGCSFNGEVPHSIVTLPRLTYLDLSWNNFSGHVDFRTFSTLENLRSLGLSGLSVSGADASNNFPKLKMLDITEGSMNNFPCFLSSMPELRELYLSQSITSEFPGSCINNGLSFPQLRTMYMPSGNLMKFPSFLSQSNKLRFLDLSGNMIKGIIPSWFMGNGIDTLEELYLNDNLLEGELHLPWKRLVDLNLQNNSFEGSIPPTLCQLTSLAYVKLGQNNLTGVIPPCLGNLTNLQLLDLSVNYLTGPLPPSMANCTSLKTIDLSYNKFQGPLPLPSSTIYYVSNNNFSGELSSLICNANGILVIDLSNNGLTGTLPHCLKNITTSLLYFNLRVNKFHGQIPEIFPEGSIGLTSLDFSRNQFEGSLPRSLSNCKRLEVLDVGSNNLVDSFPDWLGDLPLKVLSLRSNKFQSHVSFSYGIRPFPEVRILDLSNNGFDGNLSNNLISEMIGMMRRNDDISTRYMSIFSSSEYYSVMIDLKGVETEMVKIYVDFATIDLSCNNFRGEIPQNIGLLKYLKGLNFSHNGFTGIIPTSLGNLTSLESLDLSSNDFIGRIPDELVKLTYLGALNLSGNNLTGPIPTGGHFNTFFNSSFEGNAGLCGIPLTRSCGQRRAEGQPLPNQRDDMKKEQGGWFEWTFVMIGFGSGMGIGISLGYMVLETGRPLWLSRMVIRSEANCGGRMKRKRKTKKGNARR